MPQVIRDPRGPVRRHKWHMGYYEIQPYPIWYGPLRPKRKWHMGGINGGFGDPGLFGGSYNASQPPNFDTSNVDFDGDGNSSIMPNWNYGSQTAQFGANTNALSQWAGSSLSDSDLNSNSASAMGGNGATAQPTAPMTKKQKETLLIGGLAVAAILFFAVK